MRCSFQAAVREALALSVERRITFDRIVANANQERAQQGGLGSQPTPTKR